MARRADPLPTKSDKRPRASGGAITTALKRLARHLPARRRRQAMGLILFMLVGAVAEMASIGAVLPFLTLLSAPQHMTRYPTFAFIAHHYALTPAQMMTGVTALFVGAAAIAAVVRLALLRTSQLFIFRVGFELSVALYDNLLHRKYLFHMQSNSAEALANLQKVTTVTNYFLQPAMQGIISIMVGMFIVGALIYADPVLALVSLGSFTAVYFVTAVPARVVLRRNSRVVARMMGERIQNVQEGIGGIRDVLLDRAQPVYLRRYAALDRDYRNAQSMTTFLGMAPRFMIEAAGMILIALIAYGFANREGGLIEVLPMLGALAIGAQRLMPLLQQIYLAWVQMTGNNQDLVTILDFLDQPVARPPEKIEPLAFSDRLDVKSLTFAYSDDTPPAVDDVSLTIPAGATVGFVGKTGSGKSTFLDLLMGLLEPASGSIAVDGQALDEVSRWSWRANVSHVPQFIYLIDGTVAENIAFGLERSEIDMDRVREVARMARIADHIESLPDQYDSFVGERGQRLSGGQRQRIGIARALYTGRPVLVLDEATSALDTETETAIMSAIGAFGGDRTVIIVAHRLSTLRQCSQVFRFDHGRVVQQGSYDEVIGREDASLVSR